MNQIKAVFLYFSQKIIPRINGITSQISNSILIGLPVKTASLFPQSDKKIINNST